MAAGTVTRAGEVANTRTRPLTKGTPGAGRKAGYKLGALVYQQSVQFRPMLQFSRNRKR